ncbi:hypothetical protein BDQ12DRAFT_640319 [Crucibulum laeve]|uniref:Clavaminate synthase-like protein n=1 Tax=Crucibulum laeve TaxID=68775 RepID=A0A5C3LG61_9AGAR|nr:hypothetical protein BDQ12DRAFT_640319 [Crucibulum laeve]
MTISSILATSHYVPGPETKADLDYAELVIIDLAKANTVEGRKQLAVQVVDAVERQGFFYVVNHRYTIAQTERIFDIADIPFSGVSEEEKQEYAGKMKETGSYQGYKPRGYNHIDAGVRDQVEHYNLSLDIKRRQHPVPLRPFLPEIDQLSRNCYFDVLDPILKLLSLGLELPEDTLSRLHTFAGDGETWLRFMKYYPRSEDEELKTRNVWFKGHTDLGTITILFSQPISGLQILTREGEWKWIRHIENALVINTGDSLEFLSGGFYRPTIHRVVQPPQDQRGYTRLGVFLFAVPDDNVKLAPLTDSPVLKRVGVHTKRFDNGNVPTTETWRKARIATYGQTNLKPAAERNVEEEVVGGVLMRHYN